MARCSECGSWDAECASPAPVERCGCARCLGADNKRLRELIEEFCKSLGNRVKVENEIANVACGKLPMPDVAKLREWAARLGVPEEVRLRFQARAEPKAPTTEE